jgi:hypothetical protein
MHSLFKLIFNYTSIFVLTLLATNTSIAQTGGYDEDYEHDYSGYEDYNKETRKYNNYNYELDEEDGYRKRQDRFYKKSYNEEDLYNGGYKRKNYSPSENNYGIGGLNVGGINSRSNSWFGRGENVNENKPKLRDFFDTREVGETDGIDRISNDAKNGVSVGLNPGQERGEINPGDERQTETAPPPPDEPDIPITSKGLSLFMIVVMTLIVVFYTNDF